MDIIIYISTPQLQKSDIIDPSETEFLKIKYFDVVDLSNGNITIYQSNGSKRQIVSMSNNGYEEYVKVDDDNTTISVKIIDSTFNRPGEKYYVLIDEDFVKSQNYKEPIYGIHYDVWNFTTRKCFKDFFHVK